MHCNWKLSSDAPQKPAGILPPLYSASRFGWTGVRTSWLALVMATGFALPAEAQMYWPMDPGPDYYEPPRRMEQHRPRIARTRQKLPDAPKDNAKPVGPVVIAISIEKQQLKLYDQNGLFAETPVSTGMRGHSTPMGVFSIIQKNKYHRSNIYSGAPMPYMQRITWSGVAMHAGVLPGYPASHGCIRMPMNFAMRMWGWTRMGARVIVTPGEVTPADFSHPLLATRKPEAKPVATLDTTQHAETTPKSDRSSIVDAAAHEKPELRLTSIVDRHEPIRTADASGALPQKDVVASDISAAKSAVTDDTAAQNGAKTEDAKKDLETAAPATGETAADGKVEPGKADEIKSEDAKSEEAKSEDEKPETATTESPNTGETKTSKDQARATDTVAPPATVAATPPPEGTAEFIGPAKPRSGHIAAFVSRKENKIYVRQNFEPWFEAPVTIAASDRPLGTHVFTVRADKDDASALRWSVVSLPAPARAARADDDKPKRKRAAAAEPAAPAPPSSPTEALDRLTIPAETMTRIASALTPGGSLTVSDQGLGDETSRGTDFIVPLR
ncbi:L,D-transpeptidase family protein [soil metagenome]